MKLLKIISTTAQLTRAMHRQASWNTKVQLLQQHWTLTLTKHTASPSHTQRQTLHSPMFQAPTQTNFNLAFFHTINQKPHGLHTVIHTRIKYQNQFWNTTQLFCMLQKRTHFQIHVFFKDCDCNISKLCNISN